MGGRELGPLRLVLDNDANCAAAGELAFGAAKGERAAVVITLGTGIGGGVVSGGKLLRGGHGFAGEIGHTVIDRNGPPCRCGRRGCYEQFASGSTLARLARDAAREGRLAGAVALAGGDPEAVRGEHVLVTARQGDATSIGLFETLAESIAIGILNLVEVLDVNRVIIGGGLARAGSVLLDPTVASFTAMNTRRRGDDPVSIVLAELGERSGAFGASALALGTVS